MDICAHDRRGAGTIVILDVHSVHKSVYFATADRLPEMGAVAGRRKKTKLRTVRVTAELDETLQKDAEDRRLSVNALIGSIFARYSEWDRFADKLGFVALSPYLLREAMAMLTENQVERLGTALGERLPGELARFWFKKVNHEALIGLVSLYCTYGGVGEYELETNGMDYAVVVHHNMGKNWSLYLKHLMGAAFKPLGITPRFDLAGDFVSIAFRASDSQTP